MMHYNKIIFSGLLLVTLLDNNLHYNSINSEDLNVFICNGPNSKVYHLSSTCKGLNRCSTKVSKVSISIAASKGRRACKIEF